MCLVSGKGGRISETGRKTGKGMAGNFTGKFKMELQKAVRADAGGL